MAATDARKSTHRSICSQSHTALYVDCRAWMDSTAQAGTTQQRIVTHTTGPQQAKRAKYWQPPGLSTAVTDCATPSMPVTAAAAAAYAHGKLKVELGPLSLWEVVSHSPHKRTDMDQHTLHEYRT